MIKSFSVFESKDDGYFLDMKDQLEEHFPNILFKSYSLGVDIHFKNDKEIDFVEFTKMLEFWIDVLDNEGYKFENAKMSLSRYNKGFDRKQFFNWKSLKNYTLQFGGQEYSKIRDMHIQFC